MEIKVALFSLLSVTDDIFSATTILRTYECVPKSSRPFVSFLFNKVVALVLTMNPIKLGWGDDEHSVYVGPGRFHGQIIRHLKPE